MANRVRVTRTLVYEGDEAWLSQVLDRGRLSPEEPKHIGNNSIVELPRKVEPLMEVVSG